MRDFSFAAEQVHFFLSVQSVKCWSSIFLTSLILVMSSINLLFTTLIAVIPSVFPLGNLFPKWSLFSSLPSGQSPTLALCPRPWCRTSATCICFSGSSVTELLIIWACATEELILPLVKNSKSHLILRSCCFKSLSFNKLCYNLKKMVHFDAKQQPIEINTAFCSWVCMGKTITWCFFNYFIYLCL